MARWVVLALATALVALSAVVRADCPCRLQQNSTEHSLHHIFEASTYRSHGVLRDLCECGVESVQELNSAHVYPALDELRRTPFFRYFRVDLLAECPFWKEDGYCMIRDCAVGEEDEASESALSAIDRSRDHDTIHVSWPDELDDAWTNEDAEGQTHFINLMENPERYTGYKGASPHHIWNAVYQDNMFYLPRNEDDVHGVEAMKVEHRAFYKLVSGTHASISSHIAAQYLLNEDEVREKGPDVAIWGPDLDQFRARFEEHPQRVNNLYFVYMVVLRAVDAAEPFLRGYDFSTGHADDDDARRLMDRLLDSRAEWPLTIDESQWFRHRDAADLIHEVRAHVYNISRIMDCVGCERCRLWGKLQFMGLGTALRILFAPDREVVFASLHRNHVVALINFLSRLSHSVQSTRMLHTFSDHEDLESREHFDFLDHGYEL